MYDPLPTAPTDLWTWGCFEMWKPKVTTIDFPVPMRQTHNPHLLGLYHPYSSMKSEVPGFVAPQRA